MAKIAAQNVDDLVDLEAGEKTYLLSGQKSTKKDAGVDADADVDADEEEEQPGISLARIKAKAVTGAAALSMGASAAALVVGGSNPLVMASGAIGLAIAPYAAMQENKLVDLKVLENINEKMEEEVDALALENERLLATLNELEGSVNRLETMEETLTAINKMETQSVDEMAKQLEQSRNILSKMEKNMQATVLQNIISVVLRCDLDNDMSMGDDEIDLLLSKLRAHNAVEVDEDKFRTVIVSNGRSMNAIMSMIKTIIQSKDLPEEEQIIRILEE